MSALPPLRATQLRVALALVLLEHTPDSMSLSAPTTAHDASPAGLLRDIAAVTDERDDASGVESSQDIDELARSWALLDQVALAAGRLPVVEDEPGPSRAPEELESGMRTRGRVRKASDKATRADVERELTAAAHARALLARLAPTLSLAHLSLPAAPTLPPAPTNSPSYDTLEHAIDGLVRLVAGTGVDAQLAVVQLPGEEGLSVEGAVLGLLERAWAVRDTLCMADEADEAA
ncbi:hypothetical protein JCM9279_006698 [Rhodotorula babjevae]